MVIAMLRLLSCINTSFFTNQPMIKIQFIGYLFHFQIHTFSFGFKLQVRSGLDDGKDKKPLLESTRLMSS